MTGSNAANSATATNSADALRVERDFLLSSLADLETERAVGDLSDGDYQTLKDDYTVRAADLIRQIDGATLDGASSSRPKARNDATKPRNRKLAAVVGVLVFGLGAGWLLAQAAGERGASDNITGSVTESLRDRNLTCQQYMQQGDLTGSLECFDSILDEDPQNVEALTYRGWFLVLASGQAQQAGDSESFAELIVAGERSLADAVAVDPTSPDARAFRTVVFERLGRVDEACAELATLATITRPAMIDQLIEPVSERLSCS